MSDTVTIRYSSDDGVELIKKKPGDAAYDLAVTEEITLQPFERFLAPTSITLDQPYGLVGLVTARSGFSHKTGIAVINAPGVIDSGYRGEVKVSLVNLSLDTVVIYKGARVAQLFFQRVLDTDLEKVDHSDISESHDGRGTGGFGHTGLM